jgi:hypothetical protein
MKKKNLLPDKPSAVLSLGLKDLEKAERSKKYEVYMGDWHIPAGQYGDGTRRPCAVCMAGSVMAFSLKADDEAFKFPHDYDSDTRFKLSAINAFRTGQVISGLRLMDFSSDFIAKKKLFDRHVADYNEDPKKFKQEIKKLISDLKAANL